MNSRISASDTVQPSEKWANWNVSQWGLVLALLLVSVISVVVAPQWSNTLRQFTPETLPDRSTYNERQSGYSALLELCRKTGLQTEKFESSYRTLNEQKIHGTLVIVAPSESLDMQESARIASWVAAGNDILYFDYFTYGSGRDLLAQLGGSSSYLARQPAPQTVKIPQSLDSPLVKYVDSFQVKCDSKLYGGQSLGEIQSGTVLMTMKLGRGRALICSDVGFCANENISSPKYKGNFQLVMNFLRSGPQPVYFDEKCHGHSSSQNAIFYLSKHFAGLVFAQFVLIFVVAWLSLNQRFGRPVPLEQARKISNLEFIDGLASTYRRAHARDAAWTMIYHPLRVRLSRALGVSPDESASVLAAAWSESSGKAYSQCERFLTDGDNACSSRQLSESSLLSLISRSDEITDGSKELSHSRRFLGA